MCRNIKTLFNFDPPATQAEIHAAARQFVHKLSGSSKPSQANLAACQQATEEISAIVSQLLNSLVTGAEPKNREREAARVRARNAQRFTSTL